jgi:MFS transporter, ACS family, tartrate transporter
MSGAKQQKILTAVSERARLRIARRLGPFLFILYVLNYLARVNLSYASLQMTGELHFSANVFGFGAGIFFIGYFLLQIPQTILVETWSARKFIGIALIGWGSLATITGFINTEHQFYWIRFLLGIFEAGFFPGVIVYLTHWYRSADRARAVATFMLAIPISNLLGAAIAVPLLKIHWFGLSGWRWLLMMEGFPAVICGIVSFFYLSDTPEEARWLPEDEKQWIISALAQENAAKSVSKKKASIHLLFSREVIVLSLAYFCYITDSIGLGIWLPKILQKISTLNLTQVILVSGFPWLAAVPAMLYSSSHSDKTGERRWHAALPMLGVGVSLYLSIAAGSNLVLAITMISITTMALYAFPSPFWTLPTAFRSGTSAAASIALINSIGNLGGFAGPYVVGLLTEKTGKIGRAHV